MVGAMGAPLFGAVYYCTAPWHLPREKLTAQIEKGAPLLPLAHSPRPLPLDEASSGLRAFYPRHVRASALTLSPYRDLV